MPRLRTCAVLFSLIILAVTFAASGGSINGSPGGPPIGKGRVVANERAPFIEGEILVGFHPGTRGSQRANARAMANATHLRTFRSGAEHWRLGPGRSVGRTIDALSRNPNIRFAEPNYVLTANLVPDDPRLDELWGMINTGQTGGAPDADIDADQAWSVSTGSSGVLVGVIDTGVDYNHPDLAANMWVNPGEIAGNGMDDDNNGYVDDIYGYDFYNNDPDPFDDNSHGSHCSGTIGAVGDNGVGVAGVNWTVKIMALKFLSAGGSGSTAGAVEAVDYSVMMGVDLTSNSWGGGGFSQALYDAINAAGAQEMAFVAAAGNSNSNTDVSAHYPSSYDLNNIIAVAATDHNDNKASFSSYGATTVDLGAPGVDILSTIPGASYGLKSGTSMATPHVAGVAALIRSVSPTIPVAQLKTVLLAATDPIPAMNGITVSGGRLNAFFAIAEPDTVPPDPILDLATATPTSNSLFVEWTATGDDNGMGTASAYDLRYSTSPIVDDASFAAATPVGNEPNPSPAGTPESMEVNGLDPDTTYSFALKVFDEWGNDSGLSNEALGTTLPPPTGSVAPTFISEALFTGETAAHDVTLSNIGVGTLDFNIPRPSVGQPSAAGSGGPDNYGYRWIDSDDPGGPVFDWVDISGVGTRILFSDEYCIDCNSGPIPMGMFFPYYGNTFNEVRVVTNGWLSFTSGLTTYTNTTLPNSASTAPENMLAPFWDDLVLRSGTGSEPVPSRAYYYNDGTRFIVQYDNFYRLGDYDANLTFQVILYPSGQIFYQYHTMANALLDSATIGMQNDAKDDGLTVVHNIAYMHDGLAISISALPQWLTVSPTSGRLGAGESTLLSVQIDSSGLEGGLYPGVVGVLTNDPNNPVLNVDVSLDVTGAPDAVMQPAALDFGDRFLGLPDSVILKVLNQGTDLLQVTGISTSHPEIQTSPTVFDLAPKGVQEVTVTWTPSVLGAFSGSLTVSSNDAGEPTIVVPVSGNSIPAPVMQTSPSSFSETLFSGQSVVRSLQVTNSGGSDLIVDTAADQGNGGNGLVIGPGYGTEGSGGPDMFGYRWRDSDEPGGPTFDWVEISGIGTWVQWDSDNYCGSCNVGPFPLGFDFPFYGNSFNEVRASVTGFLSFTSTKTTGSNVALPSSLSSKPENLLAVFWDSLYSRNGSGSEPVASGAYYYSDGSRFIFQYDTFYRSGDFDADLDFQVILYPTGKIVYQYKTMANALLTSSTIGIQNATKDDGLTVNHNSAYMHDGLAIEISYIPDWLTVTPAHAVIPQGGTANFDVKFDTTGRFGGLLTGNVVLNTNIPTQAQVLLPAELTVIGSPQVDVYPASHDYGTVYTGYPHLTSFQVVNNGTEILVVSNVDTTDPELFVEQPNGDTAIPEAEFSLQPGESRLFDLRWLPALPYTMNAAVRVHSDDPVNPIFSMPVSGAAIDPPIAAWSPSSFYEAMDVGDVITRTLHLENNGASDLDFLSGFRLLGGTQVTVYEELLLEKQGEEIDSLPDPRPGILGAGGPDMYGYKWKDSDEPGGPAFNWVDISGVGTQISFSSTGYCDDCNAGPFPIGFPFPFYGTQFGEFNVSTNGWVSFTSTATTYTNQPLPNSGSSSPENLLAVFWDDLVHRSGTGSEPVPSGAFYYNDGTRLIIQFENFYRIGDYNNDFTFQIILYPSGRIVYQYLTMVDGTLTSATIGQQNATKDDGLTVVHNTTYMHDGLTVEIRSPFDFLGVDPPSGTIPAGGFLDLDVTFDARNLIGGDYHARLDLTTNDPANALIAIPITLDVTGIPDIEPDPTSLSFPTIFVGFTTDLPMTIRNVGTDVLTISSFSVNGDFSVAGFTTPVSLAVGEEIPLVVTFAPTVDGMHMGSLDITSDDPDETLFSVPLAGTALIPPEIDVAPPEISTALAPGGSRTKTLTVSNNGGSDLFWATGVLGISGGGAGILGSGGPDIFGYKWKDSDEPGGPVYDWVDISGVGTQITFNSSGYCVDCTSGPFPIGFPFPFYGNSFSEVRITTEGWISFTSDLRSWTNRELPNSFSSTPENLIAAFWDDLVLRNGSGSEPVASAGYYHYDGTRFIVQWDNFYRIADYDTDFTFQAILYPNGKIVFQYETMANGTLTSATIGQQNATKDDGLTIVYNDPYVHDGLAIEIAAAPEWVLVDPTSGAVPAAESQNVQVSISSLGLDEGIHEAEIHFTSNDPYTPEVVVPLTLNLSLVEPTYVDFEPDVFNLASAGNAVKMIVELPPGLDPHAVGACSVLLNDTVPVLGCPGAPQNGAVEFTDDWPEGGNGIEEISFRFDRDAVYATLGEEEYVTAWIQGEVTDVQWWRGSATVRTVRPRVTSPAGGEYYVEGSTVPIRWDAPTGAPLTYTIQISLDGGTTWTEIASGLTGTSFDWVADASVSESARIRLLAYDDEGLLVGFDDSNGTFTMAGSSLAPPRPVDGDRMQVERSGSVTTISWEWPEADIGFGPATGFRILTMERIGGTFSEVALVNQAQYVDTTDDPEPGGVVFFKIISTNAAGDAVE